MPQFFVFNLVLPEISQKTTQTKIKPKLYGLV